MNMMILCPPNYPLKMRTFLIKSPARWRSNDGFEIYIWTMANDLTLLADGQLTTDTTESRTVRRIVRLKTTHDYLISTASDPMESCEVEHLAYCVRLTYCFMITSASKVDAKMDVLMKLMLFPHAGRLRFTEDIIWSYQNIASLVYI